MNRGLQCQALAGGISNTRLHPQHRWDHHTPGCGLHWTHHLAGSFPGRQHPSLWAVDRQRSRCYTSGCFDQRNKEHRNAPRCHRHRYPRYARGHSASAGQLCYSWGWDRDWVPAQDQKRSNDSMNHLRRWRDQNHPHSLERPFHQKWRQFYWSLCSWYQLRIEWPNQSSDQSLRVRYNRPMK